MANNAKAPTPTPASTASADPITGLTAVLQKLQATLDAQGSQGSESSALLQEAVEGLNERLAQPVQTIPAVAVAEAGPKRVYKTKACETVSSRTVRKGEVIYRWGHKFVAPDDGIRLVGEIPDYAVKSGVEVGRYIPVGTSLAEASAAFWRAQYRETFGVPPDDKLKPTTLQSMIAAHLNPPAEAKEFLEA